MQKNANANTSNKSKQRNDDDLINCILDMKPPMGVNSSSNYMNMNVSNYQNQIVRNEVIVNNGNSLKVLAAAPSLSSHSSMVSMISRSSNGKGRESFSSQPKQQVPTPVRQVSRCRLIYSYWILIAFDFIF